MSSNQPMNGLPGSISPTEAAQVAEIVSTIFHSLTRSHRYRLVSNFLSILMNLCAFSSCVFAVTCISRGIPYQGRQTAQRNRNHHGQKRSNIGLRGKVCETFARYGGSQTDQLNHRQTQSAAVIPYNKQRENEVRR